MRTRLTGEAADQRLDRIREMAAEGMTRAEIATFVGTTTQNISYLARTSGIQITKVDRVGDRAKRAVDLVASGMSHRAAAAEIGVTRQCVGQMIKRARKASA